jgi:hypothetical protein
MSALALMEMRIGGAERRLVLQDVRDFIGALRAPILNHDGLEATGVAGGKRWLVVKQERRRCGSKVAKPACSAAERAAASPVQQDLWNQGWPRRGAQSVQSALRR